MQIVIDIDEDYVKIINKNGASNYPEEAIKNGTPLDKIKKQIDEQSAMHMDGDFYIRNFDVKWILEGNEVRE